MILPAVRDPRMITIRRGGSLTDEDHQLLALWAGGHAMGAARPLSGAARFAAYSAGQAACVGHVAEHDLGAAAHAIKAVGSAHSDGAHAVEAERAWQRERLPDPVRELVLEDQDRRNSICWFAFFDRDLG